MTRRDPEEIGADEADDRLLQEILANRDDEAADWAQ